MGTKLETHDMQFSANSLHVKGHEEVKSIFSLPYESKLMLKLKTYHFIKFNFTYSLSRATSIYIYIYIRRYAPCCRGFY